MAKQKDGKRFITPSGAGLAAICFFLPWMRACGQDISGFQIANHGESALWLVLIAALVIVVAFFMYDGQNNLKELKPIVIGGAGLSLLILLIKYAEFKKQGGGMFEMEFGSVGTLLGFGASLFGLQFLEDAVTAPIVKAAVRPHERVVHSPSSVAGLQSNQPDYSVPCSIDLTPEEIIEINEEFKGGLPENHKVVMHPDSRIIKSVHTNEVEGLVKRRWQVIEGPVG